MANATLIKRKHSNSGLRNMFSEKSASKKHPGIDCLLAFCNQRADTDPMATGSQQLIRSLLRDALNKRFQTGTTQQHIYLKNDEISQIQLFNILIEKFPFVKYSQLITNKAIIETIGNATEASIIDIGIGQGAQVLHVIELARELPNLKKLNIIGIEPFSDALQNATAKINACSETVSFEIQFTGINAFAISVSEKQEFMCVRKTHMLLNFMRTFFLLNVFVRQILIMFIF